MSWSDSLVGMVARASRPPRIRTDGRAGPERALQDGVRAGIEFLELGQHADGSLLGFVLPAGASTSWITAHVAFVLEGVPGCERLVAGCAEYLRSTGEEDGGWGYSRLVGIDLDSTAQASMVLAATRQPVPSAAVEWMIQAESPAGGFTIHPPRGTPLDAGYRWQMPHPEVTLLVCECLGRMGRGSEAAERGLAWVRNTYRNTLVPSYGWEGPAYGAWAATRARGFLPDRRGIVRCLLEERRVAQGAMLLGAGAALGIDPGILRQKAAALLARQLTDGSWPCEPCLRVTSPDALEARLRLPGRVYADPFRVFSTAHAVAALHGVATRSH